MDTGQIFNMSGEKKSIVNIMIDSAVIGGIAGLSVLSNGIPTMAECIVIAKAFGLAFFTQFAFERGIKKGKVEDA